MSGKEHVPTGIKNFGLVDVLVILICLSTATVSIYLFRLDLMQTIDSYDEEPAGTIIIRSNVIQRRHVDRVLWDRIFVDSPVYMGDLIRAAELSAATVFIEDNQISLDENTLIQIQHAPGGKGPLQVELQEGNLSLAAAGTEGSGITLNLMGRSIQTGPGTVLNAGMGDEGIIVQVNEGNATFIQEGRSRELGEGAMIAQDTSGVERVIPMAVVKSPRSNARYLKNRQQPVSVDFIWNRINIDAGETLRLEISGNPNFARDIKIIEDLTDRARVDFDTGLWYWRLAFGNAVLRTGQLTVADASGPDLLSPAANSVFRYHNDLPQLRFQWSQRPEATHYIIEVALAGANGETPDFKNPVISRQSVSASFIQTAPGPGIWYWRVRPVFSSVYEGAAGADSLPVASFRIEKTGDPGAQLLELPEPAPVRTPSGGNAVPGGNYIVQTGDTLAGIAGQVYNLAGYWRIIANANNIPDPDLIEVNQVLYLPPAE